MSMELNKINGDASKWSFGFKATSRSLKPVHVAQVMFSHALGHVHSPDELFKFVEKPAARRHRRNSQTKLRTSSR